MKEKSKKIAIFFLGIAVIAQIVATLFLRSGTGYMMMLVLTLLGICFAIWFGVRSLTAVTKPRESGSVSSIIQEETAHDKWLKENLEENKENDRNEF
ncbi:hypothetical protein [Lactococcus protaetiae]|uniref:Uncharacterized protein n=1 Tax=Lactococcus protaetiae TaxID=2592653 RepID=A0A514Z5M4_9LACT|nr:hypothetical protein [Lactococcus protaetiae]QDK69889.1 hypothetical protein FLP15_00275 [Lactococcus protaetiae]